ncbi:hypothetical protein ACA910_017099 [Epithemia clementina (nom. ined.)]
MDTNRPKVTVLTAGGAGVIKKTNASSSSGSKPQTQPEAPSHNVITPNMREAQNTAQPSVLTAPSLELEEEEHTAQLDGPLQNTSYSDNLNQQTARLHSDLHVAEPRHEGDDPLSTKPMEVIPGTASSTQSSRKRHELIWLLVCFLGIMASFVCYGLLLEAATNDGKKLHELSFLFVTSGLYTLTAAAGRYVRDETPTTIPPARFAVLALTSMGSTFFSVRSLRYVIYPIQVLAKSCKPVPVMLMGALMGKKYPFRKYINVCLIVAGVALFMGGADSKKKSGAGDDGEMSSPSQIIGIIMLFISLCFDGGTGAYEDKLMSVHSVQPFDLMYNIQLGKTILAGVGLLVMNEVHTFNDLVVKQGPMLIGLGLSGALGQVFIFVTIAKFGALTCSIIGLARKVTTLVASIYFYGHPMNAIQTTGLFISVASMVMNFWGKKKGGGHGHSGPPPPASDSIAPEELQKMLNEDEQEGDDEEQGEMELQQLPPVQPTGNH